MLLRFITACVIICFTVACSDPLEENGVFEPDPFIPDLEEKIIASVSGFVTDEDGNPVVFATVTAGDKRVLTDSYGFFSVKNASLSEFAAQVKVESSGSFTGYETFTPREDQDSFMRITLLEKPEAIVLNATEGGTITSDGVSVELQPNSVFVAATGVAYTGEIKIHVRKLHPEETGTQSAFPGDGRGTDEDGYARVLQSFSPVVIELTSPGGQLLQLAPGKPATVTLPIATGVLADAPNTIPLWTYNTTTGLWDEEGSAEKNGAVYIGMVTHFSFWDGAIGQSLVNVTARIVNSANQPLAHVPVMITLAGQPVNAGHGSSGFTNANGEVTGAVYANKDFVLDILTPCSTSAYSHTFSTAASAVNLSTLTGNLGQSSVVISGRAENCAGQGISNGYVQTYDGAFFHRIPVSNGDFSFNGIMCTNTTVSLVAVDASTYKQNTPQELTLVPGANAVGTMTVCGLSTMGHVTYTYDGVTTTIQEPADTIAAFSLDGVDGTQVVTLSGEPNTSQKMSFQLTGVEQVGQNTLTEVFSTVFPSGRGYWPANINVTITEYSPKGGFISGEFSSNMLDFGDNSLHTFSCSFRIRRYK